MMSASEPWIGALMALRIVKTAGPELAKEIQERGYDWIKEEILLNEE